MDNVVLINTNRNTLQEMLDITKVASRYRIQFGSQKSTVRTIGKPDSHKTLTIGNTELEDTETYKHLGMTLNNKGTLQNHTEDIKYLLTCHWRGVHFHNVNGRSFRLKVGTTEQI